MIAAEAVLRAVHGVLAADDALAGLLGGPRVHEHVPARARPPYLSLAVAVQRDWSTATEGGAEVEIEVTSWVEASRLAPLAAIQARVAAAVAFETLTRAEHAPGHAPGDAPGFSLVNVEPLTTTIERRPADELLVGRQRFRIVCEPQE